MISDFQEDTSLHSINVYGTDIKHIWRIFRIYFTEVSAAGGLVRHSSGRYLFLERRGKVDLPKGHVEPGEKAEDCALREVAEECGISGHTIVKPLIPSYHTYTLKGISYLKRTDWFLMNYDGSMISEPQRSEGITSVMWLFPDEISRIKNRAWLSLIDLINTCVLKNG
ncbi:MAG: NUDIX domain-containing protein [Bacteroidales bacterium]|nr:NUDIX domain-containing protein [Bacteroidales bacterium]